MLKAGSLFYAIVIALIIAVVSGMFILFSYYNRIQNIWIEQNQKLILNANSGLKLLLSSNEYLDLNSQKEIDLYGENTDSVRLERRHWGAFEIAVANAHFKNNSSLKAAIIGNNISTDKTTALFLADLDKPLSLCGNTQLSGTCYLPKAGVKRAYIEGQSFSGEKLVNGEIKESGNTLPEINQSLIESNRKYFQGVFETSDSLYDATITPIPDTVINSFKEQTKIIKSDQPIALINNYIRGNVRIISKTSVFIGASAKLEDIIVYAPQVIVEDGFTGNLQIFSSDSVAIGKECKLAYPSAINIIRTGSSKDNITIKIGEDTEILGVIFGYQESNTFRKNLLVSIDKGVKITGQVYVTGSVDLKGQIYGSLYCQKFVLVTPSSVYENHLLNAVIDITKLPASFVGVNLVNKAIRKGVVKWLF